MAQNAPAGKDTQDVQFKLHDKFKAFRNCGEPRSNVNLLAISSSRGLLFAGNPAAAELKVIIIQDLADAKFTGKQPQARQVPLPSIPNYMSCSADGNMLAVNYTQNENSLLNIYSVQSFMTPTIKPLYMYIRLAPEDHVHAVQLLWNPVLPNSLAIVLSNGALVMYALKEAGTFEVFSLDKSNQVKCGCWSPKGKQIVLGFPNGKLQQFKPDLTPAKTIVCPPNVHDGPFDTIALHWLSTFQFAVIFLQHGEDCNPSLYIVNAPKAGSPSYINYFDICYSLNGPRNHQFHFTHVPQWNLLLVSSANGVEVGVLCTAGAGDHPIWEQHTLLDEARIELPLNENTQEETFPLGFAYDTSSTHQLTINERKLPSMPMIHVLSTDGALLSFNFINLLLDAMSVTSPPPPVADSSGQFRPFDQLLGPEQKLTIDAVPPPATLAEPAQAAHGDISFAFTSNTVTSTPAPAKDKSVPLFGGFTTPATSKSPTPTQLTFGSVAPALPTFGMPEPALPPAEPAPNMPKFGGTFPALVYGGCFRHAYDLPMMNRQNPFAPPAERESVSVAVQTPAQVNEPLYTVPAIFNPPVVKAPVVMTVRKQLSDNDVENITNLIMSLEIKAFNQEIKQVKQMSNTLLEKIEQPSSIKFYSKRLDDLQELNEQAQDIDFELDVQSLRQALNESYGIVAECRTKLEAKNNPEITRLMSTNTYDPVDRRELKRLQSYFAVNEAQLRLVQQHLDTQWEEYQDVIRRSSKSKMHVPCMESIYQRLTCLQNMVSDQRIKQNGIKAKLKERGLLQPALLSGGSSRKSTNETAETLAESILAMSFSQEVNINNARLTQEKLQLIRQAASFDKIRIVKPQRPDRVGLKSEVILETKLKAELKKKSEEKAAKPVMAHKAIQVATVTKPAASKPAAAAATHMDKPPPPSNVPPIIVAQEKPKTSFFQNTATSFREAVPAFTAGTINTTANVGETVATSISTAAAPTLTSKPLFGATAGGSAFNFSLPTASATTKSVLSFGPLPNATEAAKSPAMFAAATVSTPSLFTGLAEAAKPIATSQKSADIKKETGNIQPSVTPQASLETAKPPPTPKAEQAKPFSFASFGNLSEINSSTPFSFAGLGASLGTAPTSNVESKPAIQATQTGTTGLFTAPIAASKPTPETVDSSTPNLTTSPMSKTFTLPTTSVAAAPTTITSSAFATPQAADASKTSGSLVSPVVATDPVNELLGTVNICKPTLKEAVTGDAATSNVFGSAGSNSGQFQFSLASSAAGGDASRGFLGSASPISTADGTAVTSTTNTTTTTAVITPTATASTTVSAANLAVAAATVVSTNAGDSVSSTFSFSSAFGGLSTGSAAPAPATSAATTTTATSAFTATTSSAPSLFGSSGFGLSPGGPFQATAAAQPAANAAAATTPTSGFFGGIPKAEGNVFGSTAATATSPPSGLFAAAASANPSPFGSPQAASTGSIFGGAAAGTKPGGFGASPASTGSIFGGSSTVANTGSPFGGSSIFGGSSNTGQSPTAAAGAPTGGSIFAQSIFAQNASPVSGGNIFGGASSPQSQTNAFGGSGGSIFGGGNSGGGGFGSFSQSPPAPGAFGGGGFAQGSGSVAQTGFGSPQQTTQSQAGGFGAKPVFGGSPSFGGQPAFGSNPTFGGAATFGSPKGFGAFGGAATATTPPAFGAAPAPPKNNIFETLGSTESGLSFGNLAQTNKPAQKPAFGGQSFMNYR